MAYTDEPRGLRFLNNINPTAFGIIVSQFLWAVGSLAFTWAACTLLLRLDGPSLTNGIPTSHEAQRQLGFALAGALLGAWTGKTIAGVVDAQQKRTADPRYVEVLKAKSEAEGAKVAAAAAVKDIKEGVRTNGVTTAEHLVGASAAADAIRARRASQAQPIPEEPAT